MAFEYRARPATAWENRAKSGGDFPGFIKNDYKEYSIRKGENWVRFLPPTWENAEHYGLDVFVHYSVGPDNATILCNYKMADLAKHMQLSADFTSGKCPICDAKARAERAGDKELADELRWSKRILVWMVDLKAEEEGPKVWSMPPTLDTNIVKLAINQRTGETLYIDHPQEGYGVSFEKEGEGKTKTKYLAVQIDRKPSEVDPDFVEFIVGDPLPMTLHWRTPEEIRTIFGGDSGAGAEARQPQRDSGGGGAAEPRPERGNSRDEGRSRDEPRPERREEAPASDKPRFEARGSRGRDADSPREEPRPDRSRPSDERGSRDARDEINDEVPFTGAKDAERDPPPREERREARDAPADAKSVANDLRARFRK